ncbi:MAG TPA: hybrid sensor histidine kinase/response regulator, partial [Desulfobacteraceae bacterium]|nr:hybrid sensor histidine kinase/response regulator [Desulfobacteraceae bacterium]
IIPSLIVASGDYLYAIPQVSLVELVSLYDDEIITKIERADDQEVYRLRGRLLPIVRLSEILARPKLFSREVRSEIAEANYQKSQELLKTYQNDKSAMEFTDSLNFVVLKVGNSHYGLIVDEIVGTEEIVVKPLHPAIKSLGIYSGATIMGNGKTALILDVGGISRHAGITLAERIMEEREKELSTEEMQSVLLFKSGPKEQLALSLPLIRRIEPFQLKNIQLIGDKEYLTVDGVSTQIIRLDHILNVSPVVEQDKMYLILPRHLKRPIGILMSGFIDVVDTNVDLDVTSYQDDGLLGTAIINDTMTLFIDIYRMIERFDPGSSTGAEQTMLARKDIEDDGIKRILLLEDISFFRNLIKGYLEEQGYRVTAVKNGKLGLDKMDEENFDLIISDIEMPVMDGWDFMKNVRSTLKLTDLPAIALTSLDSEEAKNKAIENGFNYYEVKLDRERFLRTVASALEVKK